MGGVTSAIGGVVNTVGGLIGAGKARDAQNQAATAIRDAATWARNQSAFQPFGITTGFGSSNFQTDPTTGRVTSAGYTLDPRLQAIQNNIIGSAGTYNPAQVGQAAQPLYGGASSLFNLGQGYLSTSPTQAEADYIARTQAALAPGRETELAKTRNQLFQTGRGGLATGGTTTGMMQANPELAAIYNARALQDLNITQQAQEQARKNIAFGGDLYSSGAGLLGRIPILTSAGYDPLRTQVGLFSDIEKLGMQPYEMSTALAKTISDAGARQGEFYMSGERQATPLSMTAAAYSPWAQGLQGIGSAIQSFGNGFTAGTPTSRYYGTTPGSQQDRMLAAQEQGIGNWGTESSVSNWFNNLIK